MAPGLALALLFALGPAEGDDAPRIDWDAPLECPGASWLERRVDAYLGRALEREAGVSLVGHVHRSEAGFELELHTTIDELEDRQRLRHHDCEALVELAASLAAITIDPLALVDEPPPAPDVHEVVVQRVTRPRPVVSTIVAESPTEPASPPAEPEFELHAVPDHDESDEPSRPGEARHTRLLVLATAGLAVDLFPNLAPEVHGGLGFERGDSRLSFRGELAGGATLAGRFRSADGSIGGDLLAWDIAARPCVVPRWGIVDLRACAALGGGQIRARGVGVEDSLRRAHPWLWLATELGVGVEVARNVALVLDLGANFNLLRPNFSVSSPDASYLTPLVAARGRLGVELRFF